ncbi:hypothetical protein U4E84_08265 [Halorubrum sp. AD140]|uniref:hypothetical protein n=1 Tax=Halorubrum sp. AD140 TaxID=3050073 RepID=UPI002ACC649D|nr:hypothetical protein [Halorubrum sp. AD140]MDZ5811341.1 hypothetical protein [Halorubrum sp. AD140]
MKRSTVVIGLLVVVGVGLVLSGFFADATDEPASPAVDDESLIEVSGDYHLWPYTSQTTSVRSRTLAMNVVFHADAETTRAAIERQPETEWEETDENESEATAERQQVRELVDRDWEDARSSTRYAYFEGPDGGIWMKETFELHDGTYLGTRDHVRAYESPDGAYTAVQAHEEYYDWFRLRHTVPEIDAPKTRLEDEFIHGEIDAEVRREYRGIDGGWSDGWITVIELAAAAALSGTLLQQRTREVATDLGQRVRTEAVRHADAALLGVALAAVFASVRIAGVTLETTFPALPPKAIAAPLYLVIALGLPALVYAGAPRCDQTAAFLGVVVGLGAGFVLDFATVGVAVPPDLIVHRVAVLAALGIVAMGRAAADRPVVLAGVLAWVVGLVLPLADVI